MKFLFLTEAQWSGKVSRTFENMRTEYAWMCALGADHVSISNVNTLSGAYDMGILIVPKKVAEYGINLLTTIQKMYTVCNRVAVMQEGPHWNWQDLPIEYQTAYIDTLANVDIIYAHNNIDVRYFRGLIPNGDVRRMPTLMIEDAIHKNELCRPENRAGTMVGGNMVSWYSGMDSVLIAMRLGVDITAPSMGRKQDGESLISDIQYLPYTTWTQWITELSKFKYAVHLMRTHAAGTFALNCAYLGIPCIGYIGLDTQEMCHPTLSVEVGDLVQAGKFATHLANDRQFYEHCSVVARERYKELYSEKIFMVNSTELFK
jgi:hypothetical protein